MVLWCCVSPVTLPLPSFDSQVDERFFWNRWMISDLLDDNYVVSGTFN